jgi:hypothetical protein
MHRPPSATLRRAYCYEMDEDSTPSQAFPAVRYFDVVSLRDAWRPAFDAYLEGQRCRRCHRVLAERFERLGSTLFSDDDPRELASCFEDADACTVRMLAACIVLYGRRRETVH